MATNRERRRRAQRNPPPDTDGLIETAVPSLPPPTSKEVEAMREASSRLSKRRQRVQVTMKVASGGTCDVSHNHSDGVGWTKQVTDAFGTTSHDFSDLLMRQMINAVPVSENSLPSTMNAMLAVIDGVQPNDETEAMLATQMVVTHSVAMGFLDKAKRAENIPQLESFGNLAVKLLRTYTAQTEALAKLRRGGEQTVRVEHVHVYPGGQAIVGNVVPGGTGGLSTSEDQPYALGHAASAPLPGANPPRHLVPVTGNEERPLPNTRRSFARGSERK